MQHLIPFVNEKVTSRIKKCKQNKLIWHSTSTPAPPPPQQWPDCIVPLSLLPADRRSAHIHHCQKHMILPAYFCCFCFSCGFFWFCPIIVLTFPGIFKKQKTSTFYMLQIVQNWKSETFYNPIADNKKMRERAIDGGE